MSEKDALSSSRSDNDYGTGFGYPPKATQFKPGQCINPNGRKRKRTFAASTV